MAPLTITSTSTSQVEVQIVAKPGAEQLADAVRTLKLLADETRLLIVWSLLHGEHSVTEIADHVAMQPAAVSHHLAKLRAERVVGTRRDGNRIFYAIHDPTIDALVRQALRELPRSDDRRSRSRRPA